MFRMNRLMAVPPLRAKAFSCAISGRVRMRSATCCLYVSRNGMQILRHGDLVRGVELAVFYKHALALAEIDFFLVEPVQPGMPMTISEEEEETFDLYAFAICQKL